MTLLDIRLLGPPEIRVGGERLSFRSAKALALLAYLAVAGEMKPRESLAALFWPESKGSRARANLRNTLNYLRDGLPRTPGGESPHLIIERDRLGFDFASAYALDTAAVSRAMETRRLDPLQQAVNVYRGDFLEGFSVAGAPAFDDWTRFQREQWHRRLSAIYERLTHLQAERGGIADALQTASLWLAHSPLDEKAQRQMMRLLTRDGRRHEALAQYERCRTLLEEELGVEPDARTTAVYEQIREDGAMLSTRHMPGGGRPRLHNLPPPTTPIIGRLGERALLREYLDNRKTPLVTIIGPGGVGKTRLALHAARESVGRFLDGIWLVSLEKVEETPRLVAALADALELQFTGPAKRQAQLLTFLREREMLLVLDNFEQLLPEGAEFLGSLLRRAPKVTLLVTSRERLNLRSERLLALEGLPLKAAEALFVAAARRVDATFTLEAEMAPALARISQLVGGLPLGLEMAAAWVRVLSPAAIARELEDNVALLRTAAHDIPPRHRSLRTIFDASWRRLGPEEKGALRRFALFHGGFTRSAAEAVAGASLRLLSALADKSLLSRHGGDRFALHPLLRDYAGAKLATLPEEEELATARHAAYYVEWLAQLEAELLRGARSDEVILREIEADIDNVRAAWRVTVRQNEAQKLGKTTLLLAIYYDLRGRLQEWLALLDPAIDQLETIHSRSAAEEEGLGCLLAVRGLVASRLGDQEQAWALLQRARARVGANRSWGGMVLNYLAVVSMQQGRFPEGLALAQEALSNCQRSDNALGAAIAYNLLGSTAALAGDLEGAQQDLERAVAEHQRLRTRHGEERALIHLGYVTNALGHPERAREHLRRALLLEEQIGDRTLRPLTLGHLGLVNYDQGRYQAARRHFRLALQESAERRLLPTALYALGGLGLVAAGIGEAEMAVTLLTFYVAHPHGLSSFLRGKPEQELAQLQATLSETAFGEAQARGRALTLETASIGVRAVADGSDIEMDINN